MIVIQRVDHRHRAGQGPLDRLLGLLAQELGILDEDRFLARHRAHHRRHARVIAVADTDGLAVLEIDAVQVLDERRHEMLARLFAIADDVDARVLLFLQRQAQGILFALDQSAILQFPGRPQGLGLCQPGRFGQAAGGGGGKQFFHNKT